MWDLFDWIEGSPYLVASKKVKLSWPQHPVRVSLGAGNGRFRRVFCALKAPVSPSVVGMLELDGAYLNVGARMDLPRGFMLDVAVVQEGLSVGGVYGARW